MKVIGVGEKKKGENKMWLWVEQIINSGTVTNKIIFSIIALVIIFILRLYTNKVIKSVGEVQSKRYKWMKTCNGIYWGIFVVCLLLIWYKSSGSILTFLGFFSAGLAIAIKDVFVNMIGGLYILLVKPFRLGDRIEVAGQVGDVIDIGLFQFTMLEVGNRIVQEQSTGRLLHMPNMCIFTGPLANYEKGFKYIWNEMTIRLDMTSDWEQAKILFYEIIEKYSSDYIEEANRQIQTASKQYLIFYNNLTPIIYTEIKEGAIWLNLRYLCEPRKVRIMENSIWEEILRQLKNDETIKII